MGKFTKLASLFVLGCMAVPSLSASAQTVSYENSTYTLIFSGSNYNFGTNVTYSAFLAYVKDAAGNMTFIPYTGHIARVIDYDAETTTFTFNLNNTGLVPGNQYTLVLPEGYLTYTNEYWQSTKMPEQTFGPFTFDGEEGTAYEMPITTVPYECSQPSASTLLVAWPSASYTIAANTYLPAYIRSSRGQEYSLVYGATYEGGDIVYSNVDRGLVVTLSNLDLVEGNYTLYIPAGMFGVMNSAMTGYDLNPAVTYEFEVPSKEVSAGVYEFDFSGYLTFTADAQQGLLLAYVKDDNGDVLYVPNGENISLRNAGVSGSYVLTVDLNDLGLVPGEYYTIYIPEGYIYDAGTYANLPAFQYGAFPFKGTEGEAYQIPVTDIVEEGVATESEVQISWPDAGNVSPANTDIQAYLIYKGENLDNETMTRVAPLAEVIIPLTYGYEYEGGNIVADAKGIYVNLSGLNLAQGYYELVVPAGYLQIFNSDLTEWSFNDELNFTFGVGEDYTTGVSSIVVDGNAPVVIYNINGVRVNNDNLRPGLYIINGKKVVIR